MVPRSRDEIRRFSDGFELVDPGLVAAPGEPTGLILGGVGRKP